MAQIENEIQRIKDNLLMMVSLTERNFTLAMRSLIERDSSIADLVEANDSELDSLEISIDDSVVIFIVRQRPVAHDLRLVLAASHIVRDLERIGDLSVSVARASRVLNLEPELKPLVDIPRMANIAMEMLRNSTSAFVENRSDTLEAVIKRDKSVDEINRQLFRELTSYMIENPATITRSLHLVLIARSIERIADHCKSIAEEVFYLTQAVDIRHTKGDASVAIARSQQNAANGGNMI